MIDLKAADQLLDFASRGLDAARARAQLEGAVALHNLLEQHGVAYLADEVGMGKTMVALGAVALFRHFRPDFRVLVIAPRENIQRKWEREADTFFSRHLRFADLRGRGVDDRPARPRVVCDSLMDLVEEALRDPERDFFCRLTSFSLGLGSDVAADSKRLRERLQRVLPWVDTTALDLRDRDGFKRAFAAQVREVLPDFDLVVVDEAHNLKRGRAAAAARNQVLAGIFGDGAAGRCKRLLLLSATPVEDSYRHLANQLDVFDRAAGFPELVAPDATPADRRAAARRFLVRRVTELQVGGQPLTRNMYRSEWRRGGVVDRARPIEPKDARQRLVVALMQKKVSELLGHERFRAGFQIGMLASFESFLATAKVAPAVAEDDPASGNFDDADQAGDALERDGIDTATVDRLAASHRKRFGAELPHPKMDAVVDALARSWITGEKTLVFVRRVASVKELRRKLEDRYDKWLLAELAARLRGVAPPAQEEFAKQVAAYRSQRREAPVAVAGAMPAAGDDRDPGGTDTFFAWFFRGEGPSGVLSGAAVQKRLGDASGPLATFFERNHAAELLDVAPGRVLPALASTLGLSEPELRARLEAAAARQLRADVKPARADVFAAFQHAAVDLLRQSSGACRRRAEEVFARCFANHPTATARRAPVPLGSHLEEATFFTGLRAEPALRELLWPESRDPDVGRATSEDELRAQLLAAALRLGHGAIELWLLVVGEIGSLAGNKRVEDGPQAAARRVQTFMRRLDALRTEPADGPWNCVRELADIAANFPAIVEANAPEVRDLPPSATATAFGRLLGRQQPVGGMAGAVNQTLVRQFRMPGYPLALISTDLLQEGEDLHFFCSRVVHYGIGWMPSAMEQRVGRVDRVRSLAHRRMAELRRPPQEGDKVQVYFPYLADTVEVMQVAKVLQRMDRFLELMHDDLVVDCAHGSRIDPRREMLAPLHVPEPPAGRLCSAFAIAPELLVGPVDTLAVGPEVAERARARLAALVKPLERDLKVLWQLAARSHCLLGTVRLPTRIQPFTLYLESLGADLLLRCVSPVGVVDVADRQAELRQLGRRRRCRLGATPAKREARYDLTVEADVLLGATDEHDVARARWLVQHVVGEADQYEQELLQERDHALDQFQPDLEGESRGDR